MSEFEQKIICGCDKPDCYFCWLKNRAYTTTSEKPMYGKASDNEILYKMLVYISEASGISIEDITGKSRVDNILIARQMFCYYANKSGKWTHSQIGEAAGCDRTTVIHSCKVVENMLETREPKYTELGNRIGIIVINS